MTTPNSNGPQAEGEIQPEQPTQTPAPDAIAGIQQRFDQITAKLYEKDARIEELARTNQELMQAMLQRQPAAPTEPAIEIDPEERRRIESLVNPEVAAVKRQMQQMQQQMAVQSAQYEGQAAAAQAGYPELGPQVGQFLGNLRARFGSVATAEDAINAVLGAAAAKQRKLGQQAQHERQDFNTLGADAIGYRAPPAPSPAAGAPKRKARPANFDDLSPGEQIAILEAEGIADTHF